MLITDSLNLRPVGLRRHDDTTGALYRFANECCDLICTDLLDLLLEIARRLQAEFIRGQAAIAAEPVGLPDMFDAGYQHSALRSLQLHAAKTCAADG